MLNILNQLSIACLDRLILLLEVFWVECNKRGLFTIAEDLERIAGNLQDMIEYLDMI